MAKKLKSPSSKQATKAIMDEFVPKAADEARCLPLELVAEPPGVLGVCHGLLLDSATPPQNCPN